MKLGELQAKSLKKKKQLLASIGKMLKVQTSENTMSNFDEDLFQNKWFFRKLCKTQFDKEDARRQRKRKRSCKILVVY